MNADRLLPPMGAPLDAQLGPACTEAINTLAEAGVTCWLDSGSLLGICRAGLLPPWDKDIDLGIWLDDVERSRALLQELSVRWGLRYREKRLSGQTYAIVLTNGPGVRARTLPISIHVFERDTEFGLARSAQPHLLLAFRGRFVKHELGLADTAGGYATLRHVLASARQHASLVLVLLILKLRLAKLARAVIRTVEARNYRDGVQVIHPAERPGLRHLYGRFEWQVPLDHFNQLQNLADVVENGPRGLENVRAFVPSDLDSYLGRRYGTWRAPAKNWFYVLDDESLNTRPHENESGRHVR